MSRQKKSKSAPPPTTREQQQEQWEHHLRFLSPDKQQLIHRETSAAKAACGSRLAVAKHLSQVHEILCRDLKNPKQKKEWTLYLKVTLPGVAISRSQVFKDIQAWRQAVEDFPVEFLDAFLASGYALSMRPSEKEPLGKFTETCQQLLTEAAIEEPNQKQYESVLADAAAKLKEKAKKTRPARPAPKPEPTADENREEILRSIHDGVIHGLDKLSHAIEPGETYNAMKVRDDLELIVCRLMAATETDELEVEPRPLPEGFERLSLPAPNPKPNEAVTLRRGARPGAARAA